MSSSSENSVAWRAYDDEVYRGVKEKRSCTDIYCLLILVVFVGCWIGVGYYAFWNGDINRILAPKDSTGRICGVDDDVRGKEYLFFFDISKCVSLNVFIYGCPTKQMCVKECPKENWSSDEVFKRPKVVWREEQKKLLCDREGIAATVNSYEALNQTIREQKCAPYYLRSTAAFAKMCLPTLGILPSSIANIDLTDQAAERAQNYFSYVYEVSSVIAEDMKKCWHLLVLFAAVSIVSCLFVIIVMGIITKIVIWCILGLILIFLAYSTIITYLQYNCTSESEATLAANSTNDFYSGTAYGQLQLLFQQKETWFVLFIVSAVFFVLFALLIIFLRSRIELAVMLIGEGSKAVNTIKSSLCFPFVIRVLQVAVITWFVILGFYIRSLGTSVYEVRGLNASISDCVCKTYHNGHWCLPHKFYEECHSKSTGQACVDAGCVFVEHRDPQVKTYLQMYNLFGLLWGLYFVSGLGQLVLSFCFSTWYWTYHKYDVPFFTLFYSIYATIRYHLGTVALGSFLIATCGFIRTLLEHTQRILKQSDGLLTQCMTWSMRGCFWLLQKFLIYISKNAYIMCSVTGSSFFSSSGQALGLLARNIVRAVVLDKVLDFLLLVGKITLTVLMGFLSYYAFTRPSLSLAYPLVPTGIVVLLTWIIAASFFGVYIVAVDTLFLSFLKDGELNDGSRTKPYYMSSKLKYIMSKSAKVRKH
ncbi:choline transporter-like 2 [Planococcus citri]|uniref:choline transporter-like 2 n=1 Tax=Planococcus citri TaxID=170843 RepID=UPI0031F8DC4F